jgi:hypothetical protein
MAPAAIIGSGSRRRYLRSGSGSSGWGGSWQENGARSWKLVSRWKVRNMRATARSRVDVKISHTEA